MRLKWKLRLYYGALLVALLAGLGAATTVLVLREFQRESDRRAGETARFARRLVAERLAAVDSAVAKACRDPGLIFLARRDLSGARDETLPEWVPLAARLAREHGLLLLKILDAEGRVLSSAHWPAAYYNVADTPGLVLATESERGARLVRDRDAQGDFLALEAPRWLPPTKRYVVIGGVRADSQFVADLAERAGLPIDLEWHDAVPAPVAESTAAVATGASSAPGAVAGPVGLDWVALPVSPTEAAAGLRLRFDLGRLESLQRRLAQVFAAAALAGGLLAWVLGWWASSRVTRPLEQLADGVATLAEGGTPRPIALRGSAEVRDLVAAFNRMAESLAESRERLRRAERIAAWREVARRVAHEIKNALAPIQIAVDSVAHSLHTGKGDLGTLVDDSASTVRSEVEALTRLVNAFNEMARLPDPEPQPRRLADTWARAAAASRDTLTIESRGLEALPVLLYDEDQVRQALHNLLINAYEAGARRVACQARAGPRGWEVVIADDGPGIAAEDLDRVFEPYFTRKRQGTGLGLAIVYKICTDHGWTVAVRSPAGAAAPATGADAAATAARPGTAFVIGIPARAAAPG
jgi:signal transduction histidine kinase